ncbi:hypothetical protein AAE478_008598 [Parahypoxylon ruwenzoriense]
MSSIELGSELHTGVVLVMSTGNKPVRGVTSEMAGVNEGLRDMALDGLDGKMIIYRLGFQFQRK